MACGTDFVQLSGNDDSALGFNAHGGTGCISVVANIAPRLSSEFQEAMRAGDYARALGYQDRLMPLHRAAFAEPNPAPTKFALSLLGKCTRGGALADGDARGADQGEGAGGDAARGASQLAASGLGPAGAAGELRAYRPVVLLVPGGIVGLDPARDEDRGRPREQEAEDDRAEDRHPPDPAEADDEDEKAADQDGVGHQRDDVSEAEHG